MELEPGNPEFDASKAADGRKQMPVPPEVRVLSVADVTLVVPALSRLERRALDVLYLDVLGFETEEGVVRVKYGETFARPHGAPEKLVGVTAREQADGVGVGGELVYCAANFRVVYRVVEKMTAEQIKLVQVEVGSIDEVAKRLMEREIGYERVRGITVGLVHLQLTDVGGHVVQVFEGNRMPM